MAEIDTSSYPKPAAPPAQKSFLETVSQLGAIKQQQQSIEKTGISIDADKLNLLNTRYGLLLNELKSLGPDATPKDLIATSQNAVKMGLITPEIHAHMVQQIPTQSEKLKPFIDSIMTRVANNQEAINYHYGQQGMLPNGQTTTPIATSPKFGMRATGAPIQMQPPPTAQGVGPNGQPAMIGAQPPDIAPGSGAVAYPPPVNRLPVAPPVPPMAPVAPLPVRPDVQAGPPLIENKPQDRVPRGMPTAPLPMFEEGKKQLAQDQELATQKLTAIKPALQALPLIEGLTTGLGTETYNKALAGLSNLGLLPQGMTDKVSVYQELTKKLANYVSSNPVGQRSDAAQTLAEASSPSPKTQINPALIKLTKDAIVLDRIQAMRPNAFEGQDFSQYGKHRSTFPATIDERAVGIDLMKPKERQSLLDDMKKKANTYEGKKFWNTLKLVKKSNIIDTTGTE